VSRRQIWLIGGTQESAELAIAIAQAQLSCTVSITTETAKALYAQVPELQVVVGRFSWDQLLNFLQTERIVAILDASHPYAVEISQRAIAAAAQLQIPYLRFERPSLATATLSADNPVIELDSFTALLSGTYLQGQRVLLTIGSKPLPLFASWQAQSILFARILPSPVALETALAAGFTSDRLLAIRPPISPEIERALWQHWQISLVVTKASGKPGGENIKRAVAAELGSTLVVITRPDLAYPQQTNSLTAALAFCRKLLDQN
jgi:precorrin-6A/cobalt-precorrin-6A reductase